MSRRPKPTAIKLLEGNPGKRPLNTEEPKPTTGIPEMPKELRPTARREWGRITLDLDALGVLSVVDGKALAMYCDAYADWEEAQRDCVRNGLVIETPVFNKNGDLAGYVKKENPSFNVKCKAIKTMKAFLIEFGLTPASRAKLKIEKPKPEDGLPPRDMTPVGSDDVDLNSIDETVVM
jgi:P27 family predicted phage terminase small subunit